MTKFCTCGDPVTVSSAYESERQGIKGDRCGGCVAAFLDLEGQDLLKELVELIAEAANDIRL